MFTSDWISTKLGAPPNHWRNGEVAQIKHIHRCYRNAYKATAEEEDQLEVEDAGADDFALKFGGDKKMRFKPNNEKRNKKENKDAEDDDAEDGESDAESGDGRDEEDFLPKDSPLRSKAGDKKAPANPTFKDFQTFENSCTADYWRSHFEAANTDRVLSNIAKSIVNDICIAQSTKELRVKKGNIPLRKNREQITPLALVLHEFKLWLTHKLRTANVFNQETYLEINHRIKYLDAVKEKEVWGDTANMLAQGMRAVAHDKLLRLFLGAIASLQKAHAYALRGYSQRSSREKLERIQNNLKDVLFNHMGLVSNLCILDKKLCDPKTYRLQAPTLFNAIQDQGFVNYGNYANVLFYKLCQNALVQASFTGEYDRREVQDVIENIGEWPKQNLFCRPGEGKHVEYLVEASNKIMPAVYTPAATQLKNLMKQYNPNSKLLPLPAKTHVNRMKKAYESADSAAKVSKLVMKNAAAVQDLVPTIYAAYQLWVLAGDAGDFTVYDTLRDHVIMIMKNTIERVDHLEKTSKSLLKEIKHLCKVKEAAMKERALKTGKPGYKPAWVINIKFIENELLAPITRNLIATKSGLLELARDAYQYNLTSDQINDKVEKAKKIFNALAGGAPEVTRPDLEPAKEETNVPIPVKSQKKDDWLQTDGNDEELAEFGTNNAFGDTGLGAAYNPFSMGGEQTVDNNDEDSDDY